MSEEDMTEKNNSYYKRKTFAESGWGWAVILLHEWAASSGGTNQRIYDLPQSFIVTQKNWSLVGMQLILTDLETCICVFLLHFDCLCV